MASFPEAAAPILDAFAPELELHVGWGGERVAEGAQLSPATCKEVPSVCFSSGGEGKLYTIVLSDPDAPNPTEPKFAEWCVAGRQTT